MNKIRVGDHMGCVPGTWRGTVSEGYIQLSRADPSAADELADDADRVCRKCLRVCDVSSCPDCEGDDYRPAIWSENAKGWRA